MQQPNPDFFHSSRGKIRNLLEGTVPCCALRLGIDSLPHERNALDSSVLLEKSFKGLTSNTTLVPYSQDMHCTLHGPQRSPIPGQITGFGNGVWTRIRQSISCSLVQTKSLHGYGRCLNKDPLDRSYLQYHLDLHRMSPLFWMNFFFVSFFIGELTIASKCGL